MFEAFRSDMTQKPQWSELPAAQTAMKALTALSDSPSVSDHMGGHDDDQYYADETAIDETAADKTAVDETPIDNTTIDETAAIDETAIDETAVDETAVDETAPRQDIEDAPSHAPYVGVTRVNRRKYEDYNRRNAPMRSRRLDISI